MEPYRYIVYVEGAILCDGRYLIVTRGAGEAHAAGTLSFVGGGVEVGVGIEGVLEATLRREIREEVGVEVAERMEYVESKSHPIADGEVVIGIIFLCRYTAGTARAVDSDEVGAVHWMTAAEVLTHPDAPVWTRRTMERVEERRLAVGW